MFLSQVTTFNTRVPQKLLNEVNEMIEKVCIVNSYYYIENGNGNDNDLFKDAFTFTKFWQKNFCHVISL